LMKVWRDIEQANYFYRFYLRVDMSEIMKVLIRAVNKKGL